jgi:hypothetical protein
VTSPYTAAAITNAKAMIAEYSGYAAIPGGDKGFWTEQVKFWQDTLTSHEAMAARETGAPPAPTAPAAPAVTPAIPAEVRDLARQYAASMPYEKAVVKAKVVLATEAGATPEFTEKDVRSMSVAEMDAYLTQFSIDAFPAPEVDPWSPEAIEAAVVAEAKRLLPPEYLALDDAGKSEWNANAVKARQAVAQLTEQRAGDLAKARERNPDAKPEFMEAFVPSIAARVAHLPVELRPHAERELAAAPVEDDTYHFEPIGESTGFDGLEPAEVTE